MESLLFVNLTLSEQEKLTGGDSNTNTVRMQINSSGDIEEEEVVNFAWSTKDGTTNGFVAVSVTA